MTEGSTLPPAGAACSPPKASAETTALSSPIADEIRRVVLSHQGQVRACYEHALDRFPKLRGCGRFGWTITKKGVVATVVVEASDLPELVTGCVVRVIEKWTFDKGLGKAHTATWTFVMSPPGG